MLHPPVIILIRPQMGENIGAVARAMANFGLSELRIVAPRDGWPNASAEAMATNALSILHAATLCEDVPSALADIHMAYATTARPRDVEKPVMTPNEAMATMPSTNNHQLSTERVALVFGPERTGLTNEDLSWCHAIITIPTAENASLNVAQSAVVVLYEWFKQQGEYCVPSTEYKVPTTNQRPLATVSDYQHFFTQLETALDAADFFKVPEKKAGMMHNIKAMFLRGKHTQQELRTLHGIVQALANE